MGLLLPKSANNENTKFNGIRRTADGMLYLTSIDPNVDNESIQYSNYHEEGKSDLVPKDGSDYVEERLELINVEVREPELCLLLEYMNDECTTLKHLDLS